MTSYRPGGSKFRSFSPGKGGGRSFRPSSEPRSVSPAAARKLWRELCAAAMADALRPETTPQETVNAIKAVGVTAFPLEAGDLRGLYAASVLDQLRLFGRSGTVEGRRDAAALITAGARFLESILIRQGTDLARAGMARLDPGEREG